MHASALFCNSDNNNNNNGVTNGKQSLGIGTQLRRTKII